MGVTADLILDGAPAAVQRVRLHNGSLPASVGIVVHLVLFVGGIVPDLVGFQLKHALFLGPPQNAFRKDGVHGVRKQGQHVHPHVAIPSISRTRMKPSSTLTSSRNSDTAGIMYSRSPLTM